MTGYLEVTREPAQLELLPGASGRVDYVVTNKTGQKDYVRAVIPTPTRLTLAIVGGTEMMVENNSTTSFTLEVTAKPDAAPGDEDLSLTFVAARDSDKFSATAPSTRTVVKPKATPALAIAPNKPFPWWIVAVVGGVLLAAVAVIVVMVMRDDPKEAGEVCAQDSECVGGLSCIEPRDGADDGVNLTAAPTTTAAITGSTSAAESAGAKKCLKPLTAQCAKDSECATAFCKASAQEPATSVCSERIALGGACATSEECRAPGQCKSNKCLLSVNVACSNDGECESGYCAAAATSPAKQCQTLPEFGQACASGRRCSANLTCGPTGLEVCLYSNEQPCQLAQSCASLFCSNNQCTLAPTVGAACVNNQCGYGQVCERSNCLKPTGAVCAQAAECASGKCTNQACDPFGGIGDLCASNEQCSSGLQCFSSKCLSVVSGTCSAHNDCTSNRCRDGKCLSELRAGDNCDPKTNPCAYSLTCDGGTCKRPKFWLDIGAVYKPQLFEAMRLNKMNP
jgi:hypothetical protein